MTEEETTENAMHTIVDVIQNLSMKMKYYSERVDELAKRLDESERREQQRKEKEGWK
jgi:hypothetical protein